MPLGYSRDSIADLQSLFHTDIAMDKILNPSDDTLTDLVVEEVEVQLQPISILETKSKVQNQTPISTVTERNTESIPTSSAHSFDYVDYYDESYHDSNATRGNVLRNMFPFLNKRLKNSKDAYMVTQEEPVRSISETTASGKNYLNENTSILKNRHQSHDDNYNSPSGLQYRRSILPIYTLSARQSFRDVKNTNRVSNQKNVTFNTLAKIIHVLPISEMSYATKTQIWWQRSDYDEFKRTGRVISKAMLQGGSEIWLQSSGNNNHTQVSFGSIQKKDEGDHLGDKWWCKFGHSRRGLEHVVSIEEGRQRQKLVDGSIQAVLDEQTRQRISNRNDAMKLATVSMQYTNWAKDLALAAAAADADAVQSGFDVKAKCRLEHLRMKLNMTHLEQDSKTPCANLSIAMNSALNAKLLDANIPKPNTGAENVTLSA